jgi:hypothetical protein
VFGLYRKNHRRQKMNGDEILAMEALRYFSRRLM